MKENSSVLFINFGIILNIYKFIFNIFYIMKQHVTIKMLFQKVMKGTRKHSQCNIESKKQ